LLAEVPVFDGKQGGPRIAPSDTAAAEAFQLAISAIALILEDTPSPTLVVTSARPNDGKTLVALNLCAVAGSNGQPTLLVDADERARGLTLLAGATANTGLPDLAFRTDVALADCIRQVAVGDAKFNLLTAGTKPHDTAGFFRSSGFRETLSTLRGQAELTLIDSPPILAVADTVNIASQADGVVMVVDRGTPMRMLRDARDRLDLAGVPIVGYVFNRSHLRGRGYGYGGDGKS
jgi:Mrp family chromosome partitioning ATPase